jgi:hypothetical protein
MKVNIYVFIAAYAANCVSESASRTEERSHAATNPTDKRESGKAAGARRVHGSLARDLSTNFHQ